MADINHVFARFHDKDTAPQPQRELLSIPRKGHSNGSRTVEVVHLRSGAPSKTDERGPRAMGVRAATWSEGFPTKAAPDRLPVKLPAKSEPEQPTVHVMPMWEPIQADPKPPLLATSPHPLRQSKRRDQPRKIASETAPIAADPFDPNDDRTNCLRCGRLVQPAREQRGLMTCAACG